MRHPACSKTTCFMICSLITRKTCRLKSLAITGTTQRPGGWNNSCLKGIRCTADSNRMTRGVKSTRGSLRGSRGMGVTIREGLVGDRNLSKSSLTRLFNLSKL